MNIIYKLRVENHKDLYDLTMNPTIQKMTSITGDTRKIASAAIYEDVKDTGEVVRILSFKDKDNGDIFATNSPTFIRDFENIRDMLAEFSEEPHTIKVESGTSRAGHHFITCVYVD